MKKRRILAMILCTILLLQNGLGAQAGEISNDEVPSALSGQEQSDETDSQETDASADAGQETENEEGTDSEEEADEELLAYIKEAQNAFGTLTTQENIMALVYLCDYYQVKTLPDESAETVIQLPSGTTVLLKGVELDEDYNVWFQVSFESGGSFHTGYVEKSYLAYSNEHLIDWENTYFPQAAMFAAASTSYMDVEQFPASYQAKLMLLKQAHPDWILVRQNVRIDWQTVVKNENYKDRSLISGSMGAAYKGDYYGSGWYYASEAAVKYYLDPRNFLNDTRIFQFEQLTYNSSYHSRDAVQNILNNTFMKGSLPDSSMTYADAFFQVGSTLKVSPFHLACRVYQEQGEGKSALISGTYDAVPAYKGYYNYYNISASGKTTKEIVESGLAKAVALGWNTPYASIKGGAEILARNYILRGQDTLYLQKFDVDASDGTLYTHQYMQNIMAPYSESSMVKSAYAKTGALDSPFVFKIPVYDNMPEQACPVPSGTVTPTVTPTPKATATPSVSPTPKATATPSVSPTPKATATPSVSPTPKATATPGVSPTPKATATPITSPVPAATPKATAVPTAAPVSTPKATAPPTVAATATPKATAAPTAKATATPTVAATPKATLQPTAAPAATSKATALPMASASPGVTAAPAASATPIASAAPTASATPSASAAPTASATPSASAAPTASATPGATATPAATSKATAVPTATPAPAVTSAPAVTPASQTTDSSNTSSQTTGENAGATTAPEAVSTAVPENVAAASAPTAANVNGNTNSAGVTVAAVTPKPQTAAEDKDVLTMDMSKTGMIYAQTLQQIKEQGREVVLQMSDQVSWTIHGDTIETDHLEDINLKVSFGNSQIPEWKLETLTAGETYVEMALEHEGEFGFTAVLSVQLEDGRSGQYANLFYYNEQTGDFEFMCASLISSKGIADFEFKHASDYVIIISNETKENLLVEKAEEFALAQAEAEEAVMQAKEELPAKEPGKAAGIIVLILLASVAIGIGAYLIFKKKD